MSEKKHRVRKILLIVAASIVGLLILLILFLSPIVKYLVEKYDEQYTGRQITMDWAYVNPLTGHIHFNDLKIHEYQSDSVFFHCDGLSVNLSMGKLFHKEYEIKSLTLSSPRLIIIQKSKDVYNFTDIVKKFSSKPKEPKKDTTPVHFNLLDVKIRDGVFTMHEMMTPVNYSIKNLDVDCSGKRWNADTINTSFSFESGIGSGKIKGKFNMNTAKSTYSAAINIAKLDMKIIEQYMRDMSNYGTVRAFIDADVKAKGHLKDARNLDAEGYIGISDFHFGKTKAEDFASFRKFSLAIRHLNPQQKKYIFDSVALVQPFARYEKYDVLDNIQNMFGRKGENVKKTAQDPEKFNLVVEIARYVKKLSKNFFHSDYKVNRIAVYNADFEYADYSINEKFFAAADPLTVIADSVNSSKDRVNVNLNTGIKPYGNFGISLSINPKDSSDFDMSYSLQKLNATLLNPYLVSKTQFPLDRGAIEFKGDWHVSNGAIRSNNHLIVIDPRIARRVKANENKWLPLKVAMFFVRERGNAIDYQVPITGNLKDPTFHLGDVIWDVVSNIFIKPATPVYHYELKTVENNIEKVIAVTWPMRSADISDQSKFLDMVADFLEKNPDAKIDVTPTIYEDKEKEYIELFEAKKLFFMHDRNLKSLTKADSAAIDKLSPKDSSFMHFLKSKVSDKMVYTVQERCRRLVGTKKINQEYDALEQAREKVFMDFFHGRQLDKRVILKKRDEKVPFNGFSYFRIEYSGKIPEATRESFEKLREFDNEAPRKKLLDERKKTRRFMKPQ